ncbi:MAG TPA: ATP-dependent DNA helicase [Candidatus Saccharimonadales bacterium]|nr:ATP-dependent DNA helicase [Candidatus Saccharimonadales bacterium]
MELKNLNPDQRQAVEHDEGPLLVVAGAGTGKTQVITGRAAHLINQGKARPSQILALTFTEKAAKEMEERLDLLLPYGLVDTKVMTFHSFGSDILSQYGTEIGLDGRLGLINQAQQRLFLRQNLDAFKLNYFAPIGDPVALLGDLATYFSRLKEELITPKQYLAWAKKLKNGTSDAASKLEASKQMELAQAFATYNQLMRQRGLIDFSDQVSLALELLLNRANILKSIKTEIKYIMVDEFQDTNLAQARLIETLAGADGNIMVVGDDDQSIYKFRGAAISNILEFKLRYPKTKQIVLTKNYRSTQQILDAAYQLIQHNNPFRLEIKNKLNKRLVGTKPGKQPEVRPYTTFGEEADKLAESIKADLAKGLKGDMIAVLVRNRKQAAAVIDVLERKGINYHYSGGERLFEQEIVREMLSFLQYMTNPDDDNSLYNLLSGPIYNSDIASLARLSAQARKHNRSLDQEIRASTEDISLSGHIRDLDSWRRQALNQSAGELLYAYIDKIGYLKRLTDATQTDPGVVLQINKLAMFFTTLAEFQQVSHDKTAFGYVASLGTLTEEVEIAQPSDFETGQDLVQVMTIHKSKGLEFEAVYLFDLTAGAFPPRRRAYKLEIPIELATGEHISDEDWHLAEERRLMYVAMTRAKTKLIMSYSTNHGGIRAKRPSQFLAEALGHEPQAALPKALPASEQIKMFGASSGKKSTISPSFLHNQRLDLSVHQVEDYLMCPLNFYWKYVLNVPQPVQPAMLYGTAIHAVISYYFQQRRRRSVDLKDLEDYFAKTWQVEGYASKGQEARRLKSAQATIKRFHQREEAGKRWPKYVERSFNFELAHGTIRGRYDAIYEDSDGVEIRDFKTSQVETKLKADEKARASLQISLYALGWFASTKQLPTKLVLDYVETGQIGVTIKTAADIKTLEQQVNEACQQITSGSYPPGKNHFHCIHDKL